MKKIFKNANSKIKNYICHYLTLKSFLIERPFEYITFNCQLELLFNSEDLM